jgi:outer membrane protein OmpA-like peptidoglycan-associated protein
MAPAGAAMLMILTFWSGTGFAQTVNVEGLIKSRSGATMTLQTADAPQLTVLMNGDTKVGQIQGVLQVRHKDMSAAALIPGLAVRVEGTYNEQKELVATSVKFKGDDLKQAQSIQAGLHETEAKLQETEAQAERNKAEIEKHSAELDEHKAAIAAAVARFGQLDDYYILDEVTVLFANGKSNIDAKYRPDLLALAEKAKTINGYMIQVKGYASSTGSAAANQKLSEDRAGNIVNLLLQEAHVPLVNMLAAGAMGESQQVGEDQNSAEGQAQNRRVVVRVLQNKGIAGM